ncbi:MAG: MoaD/ThiS family protein [Bacillota bacterium]|nr:MoaD/ThiS family protein [Bacillota bacterium]
MSVKVKLFSSLREHREDKECIKECSFDLNDGTTVADAADKLQVKKEDIKIVLINGRDAELTSEIKEGDVVALFPPTGGM